MSILFVLQDLINSAISIYEIALLAYFLMSWFPNARGTTIWNILYTICEPYVGFFRRFIPPIGNISFAGIVAIFVLSLISVGVNAIFGLLYGMF